MVRIISTYAAAHAATSHKAAHHHDPDGTSNAAETGVRCHSHSSIIAMAFDIEAGTNGAPGSVAAIGNESANGHVSTEDPPSKNSAGALPHNSQPLETVLVDANALNSSPPMETAGGRPTFSNTDRITPASAKPGPEGANTNASASDWSLQIPCARARQ